MTFNDPVSSILSVAQLELHRDERCLFRDLSFDLRAGQLLQIAGPNGVGKSSLIRAIAGLLRFESGRVDILGQSAVDLRRDRCLLWTALGGIKRALDARTNLQWLLDCRGDHGDPDQLLADVGLRGWEDVPSGSYRLARLAELRWPHWPRVNARCGYWTNRSTRLTCRARPTF